MDDKLYSIITTIQQPTEAVRQLVSRLRDIDAKLVVIGDQKGPASFDIEGTEFLPLEEQLKSPFDLARKLPLNHYARKNVGYLEAISQGAVCIYETDDDNAPLPDWVRRKETVETKAIEGSGWVNIYQYFTEEEIWPRGFPLDEVAASYSRHITTKEDVVTIKAPIQQGLVNNSPDVDAIWRLILDRPFHFQNGQSLYLPPKCWCPFNTQSTWWWPEAYPLMYLPSYCSFRMTDIWRSFVAQRCLWEMGYGMVFHAPEVVQNRNEHNLMHDFEAEIPGYTRNKELVDILERLTLEKGIDAISHNLLSCYEVLVTKEFFPEKELELVKTWLEDLGKVSEV